MSARTLPEPCFVLRYDGGQAVDETYGMPVGHVARQEVPHHIDPDNTSSTYIQEPERCQLLACDRCGVVLDDEEGGDIHFPIDVDPAEVAAAVQRADWRQVGPVLLCDLCTGRSVVDRDTELQRARNVVDRLMNALRQMPSDVRHNETRDLALIGGMDFIHATDYLGPAFSEDAPLDRLIVAHAAKTLLARAGAVEDGVLWHDPDMIEALQIKTPGGPGVYVIEGDDGTGHVTNLGPTIEVAPVDKRWIRTMSPHVGQAMAALLQGSGSAVAVARAILFRPDEVENADREGDDDE